MENGQGGILRLTGELLEDLPPSCGANAFSITLAFASDLPPGSEVKLISEAGWISRGISAYQAEHSPSKHEVTIKFDRTVTAAETGPAFVCELQFTDQPPGWRDFILAQDGIVQVDIIAPDKRGDFQAQAGLPYPNPASEQLHWRNRGTEKALCSLLDLQGRPVARKWVLPGMDLQLDLGPIPGGSYFLHASSPQTSIFKVHITH